MYYEEYIRDENIIEKTEEEKKTELITSIIRTKTDLDNAHKNFEFAEDGLIDYYSYQIKAAQAKLDYLLKKAKNSGIVLGAVEELQYRII